MEDLVFAYDQLPSFASVSFDTSSGPAAAPTALSAGVGILDQDKNQQLAELLAQVEGFFSWGQADGYVSVQEIRQSIEQADALGLDGSQVAALRSLIEDSTQIQSLDAADGVVDEVFDYRKLSTPLAQSPMLAPEMAPPAATAAGGLNAALSGAGRDIGTYQVANLRQEKDKLIQAAAGLGASKEETAWLLAHAMIEDQSMQGAHNGDGKSAGAYNVGIFNMNVDMVMSVGGYTEEQARGVSYTQSVEVMLKALHTLGFGATEAMIRGGRTGLDELSAGLQTDTFGVREWIDSVALRTNAVLANPDLFSGDARFEGSIRRV